MNFELGPKPTRKALERNAHKNYILRMKVLRFILEQLAIFNGKNTDNFGVCSQMITKDDGTEIRQFFSLKMVGKDLTIEDHLIIYPIGIIWNMVEAYCYDKVPQSIGIMKINSKVKPVILKSCNKPVLVEWVASDPPDNS